MTKLTKHKLSDLYTLASGISSSKDQAGHGQPFLSFSTAFNNVFLPDTLPDLMASNQKEQEKHSIRCGDVFLTRTSEVVDELAISSVAVKDYPSATFSGFLKRLRPKENGKAYPKYMALYLRSQLFRKAMDNNAVMTLRASFNKAIFSYLDVWLPNYDKQVEIGDLLFAIEEKISLNNKINAELEAMAKLVYDYWFIQFDFPDENGKPYKSSGGKMVWCEQLKRDIPEGWKTSPLSRILTRSATGLNPRDHFSLGSGDLYYVTIKDVSQGRIEITDRTDRIDQAAADRINRRSDLKKGDVLFTSIEPVGVTYLLWETPKKWNINESIFTLRADTEMATSEFLYMLLSSDILKAFCKNSSTGSIHKGIRHEALKSFPFPLPDYERVLQFTELVSPLLQQQFVTAEQNLELANLRDWLLPMLMNGQVSVGE